MIRKRRRKTAPFQPFASFQAFLFLALLTLAPVISARVIADSFGGRNLDFDVTPGARAQTRDAIDRRFRDLLARSDDKRADWSALIAQELDQGRFSSARGLLLAGPDILDAGDAASIRESAAIEDLAGDAALEIGALRSVDDQVRARYEAASAADVRTSRGGNDDMASPGVRAATVEPDAANMATLDVLGDSRDLAMQAGRWLRNEEFDQFNFTLSGLGLTVIDPRYRSGASVVRSAHRARRLNPDLHAYLSDKIYQSASLDDMRRKLTAALQNAPAVQTQGSVVEAVFRESVEPSALIRLEDDLGLIRDIARHTSTADALEFLQIARSSADLRRARLVAVAGGDRAVALARLMPDQVLDTAQTEIPWTNRLRLMIVSLGAIAILVTWLAFSTLLNSFWRQGMTTDSAVYARKVRRWQLLDNKP